MSKLPGHAFIADIPTASPEKAKRFVQLLAPLVKHGLENEPKTHTYHFGLGEDKKTIKGFELYEDRSALEDVHLKSDLFGSLGANVEKEGIIAEGASLKLEHATPVAGFLVRPNAANHGNHPNAFIWTGKFTTLPGKADDVIAALKENIPYIESSEPETLSFVVLKGADEPDAVYVWERYASEKALKEIHFTSEGYAKMRAKVGPLLKVRDIAGFIEETGFLIKQGGSI